jgi:hypothetical protein
MPTRSGTLLHPLFRQYHLRLYLAMSFGALTTTGGHATSCVCGKLCRTALSSRSNQSLIILRLNSMQQPPMANINKQLKDISSSFIWLNLYLKELRVLELAYCSNLVKLPDSLGELNKLTWLSLVGCSSLEKLPDTLGDLKELTKLLPADCSSLKTAARFTE